MGLFDFLTGGGLQSDGSLWGRAAANSPEVMKYYLDQMQSRSLASQADNIFGAQAAPAQAAQYAGPQGPTKYGAMDLNVGKPMQEQPTPQVVARPAQQATGLFAGASPTEARWYALQKRLMQAGQPMGTTQSFNMLSSAQDAALKPRSKTEMDLFLSNPAQYAQMQKLKNMYRQPLVSISNKMRGAEEEALIEDLKSRYKFARSRLNETLKEGRTDPMKAASINRALDLLQQGYKTGIGQVEINKLKNVAKSLGLNVDNVAGQEELFALLSQRILDPIQFTKGAVSDKEMALFELMSASPSKTPEANVALLEMQKAKMDRDREVAQMIQNEYRKNKYVSPLEIDRKVDEFIAANPIVPDELEPYARAMDTGEVPQGGLQIAGGEARIVDNNPQKRPPKPQAPPGYEVYWDRNANTWGARRKQPGKTRARAMSRASRANR